MNNIQLTVISAGILAVVMNIFESIYPAEKYAKQMRIIFSLIFVICIARPFFGGIGSISDSVESINVMNDEIHLSSDKTLDYFKNSIENNISSRIKNTLAGNKISVKEVKTSINISENGSISINEITIAAENAAEGAEIIDIVRRETGEDTTVKIKESN